MLEFYTIQTVTTTYSVSSPRYLFSVTTPSFPLLIIDLQVNLE